MEFRILGPVEVRDGGGWVPVPPAKQRALLSLLLLRPGQVLERDWLVEALWNGNAPASAARLLAHYVWRLRGLLPDGPRRLRTVPSGYLLDVEPRAVDHERFTALVATASETAGRQDPGGAADQLTAALALWRGPALADVPSLPVIESAARRLHQLRVDAAEHLAEAQLGCLRPAEALAGLEQLVTEEPFRERPWRLLMLALHRLGRRPDAVAAYQRLRQVWTEQLGVEPSQELTELHRRVLADDPSLPQEPPAEPAEPPAGPAAGGGTPLRPAQLPADPPAFTGRASELARLLTAASGWSGAEPAIKRPPGSTAVPDPEPASGTVVVHAIDGAAGVGKTALAVHAAHRLAGHYPDGQLFLDLHGFTEAVAAVEPAEALERMLRALGVPGERIPAPLDDRAALWRSRLAGRRVLVVLDNAATEAQVRPLLPGSPGCLVLVTSRTRLPGLDGARWLSLEVLSPPDARSLFVTAVGQTAGEHRLAAEPAELLDELVALCGRLPLAIRIAAARLASHPTWGVAQLAERLRDHRRRLGELAAGQRSVTAALDLSYQHLSAGQQRGYRLLGLHPGPDIDPFAAAALTHHTPELAGRLLDHLLEAHLLQEPAPGRYRFHDLTRAHAAELAARTGRGGTARAALARLFGYYRYTAAVAMDVRYPYDADQRPHPPRPDTPAPAVADPARADGWLDAELPNLLAVATHAADHGCPQLTIDLSSILGRHLRTRCDHAAASTLHTRALAVAGAAGDRAGELGALTNLGLAHTSLRRHQPAEDCFTRALAIARDLGDRVAEVTALSGIGHVYRARGQYQSATDALEQALAIARRTGHRRGALVALLGLGYVHRVRGGYRPAAECFAQARAAASDLADRVGEAIALSGLGTVHRAAGRYRDSAGAFRQALSVARAANDRIAEVTALWGLGQVHYQAGEARPAADSFASALALARDVGDPNGQFEGRHGLGLVRCATGRPDQALADHRAAHALARELEQPLDQARALHGMARAHRELGQPEQARRCWQQSLSILERLGVDDVEEASIEDIRAQLASAVPPRPAPWPSHWSG